MNATKPSLACAVLLALTGCSGGAGDDSSADANSGEPDADFSNALVFGEVYIVQAAEWDGLVDAVVSAYLETAPPTTVVEQAGSCWLQVLANNPYASVGNLHFTFGDEVILVADDGSGLYDDIEVPLGVAEGLDTVLVTADGLGEVPGFTVEVALATELIASSPGGGAAVRRNQDLVIPWTPAADGLESIIRVGLSQPDGAPGAPGIACNKPDAAGELVVPAALLSQMNPGPTKLLMGRENAIYPDDPLLAVKVSASSKVGFNLTLAE